MSPKALDEQTRKQQSRHRHTIESCTIHLHSWKPFSPSSPYTTTTATTTTAITSAAVVDSKAKPYSSFHTKRPCLSDRTTTTTLSSSYNSSNIETIDMSRLSLFDYDDDRPIIHHQSSLNNKRGGGGGRLKLIERKRRRRHGSRSVSGRSSDGRCLGNNNNNKRRGGGGGYSVGGGGGAVSAAGASYATCSDFPVAIGTDSSGEMFGNGGDANWSSDVSEATKTTTTSIRKDKDERELLGCVFSDNQGDESGYGSEPGYRADAEIGYDDDEEEDDSRLLFWGQRVGDSDTNMEMVAENNFSEQKSHHRSRRKKHDWTVVDLQR